MRSTTIIIPAYKEEKNIEAVLKNLYKSFSDAQIEFEILVIIDKAPNDKTHKIVETLSRDLKKIKSFQREEKTSVASAIKEGIKKSSNDITIIAMADNSESSQELVLLAKKMDDGYDMVFGNRFIGGRRLHDYPLKKLIVNRICNFIIRVFFGINSTDITNAVKAYDSSLLKELEITSVGFEIFIELPIRIFKNGHKNFTEIPIQHYARPNVYSKFNLLKEGQDFFGAVMSCFLKKLFKKNNF